MTTKMAWNVAKACADKTTVTGIEAPDLTSLAELTAFPNLVSLSLTGNRALRDLGPLAALTKLEELWLDDMDLTAIPDEVARLERLRLLFLGKNSIKDFSLLKRLPQLVDLGLESLGLKKIPDEVLTLSELRIIGLFGNEIGTIAPLGKLKKLEQIFAGQNKLKQIPDELKSLPNLQKLDVMHNYALTTWGPLESLSELRDLSLTNAHALKRLPAGIFSLAKLTELTISIHWNAPPDPLDGLEDIGKLTELKKLRLCGAAMTTLPKGIGTLAKLEDLDLSDSKLLADVDALAGLPCLRTLDLDKCEKLADVGGLRDLPALESLKLTSTAIKTIPASFSSLKRLKTLEVAYNKSLASVPGLVDLPALETLTLFTSLRELPPSLGTLTSLKTAKLAAKGSGVEFVAKLVGLEELYLAHCTFDTLPPLPKLARLTIYRDDTGGSDETLASFPRLEELLVAKPTLKLPVMPSLRTLTIRDIAKETDLDLGNLRAMPALRELTIKVCETLKVVPAAVATAPSLTKLSLELLDAAADLEGLAGAPIVELVLDGCEKLTALPDSLAALPRLERLTVESCDALVDLSVLGKVASLKTLVLERLDAVTKLPSMEGATALRDVRLVRLKALKDVSGLAKAPALTTFVAEDCAKLPAAAAAAIANRLRGEQPTAKTTYADFMKKKTYRTLTGKEDSKHAYRFPLSFDVPEALLETMEGFSWLDDHRDDGEDGDLQRMLAGEESSLVPLAVLDFGFAGCEDETVDSYAEEIFLVDTADARNPVLLWGHDGMPKKIHDSFDAFLASLRDFVGRGAKAPTPTGGALASLQFVEGSSSKFWKISVSGSAHTVTYGKLGTSGTSKTKSFPSAEAATKDATKLIAEKRGKGYTDAK